MTEYEDKIPEHQNQDANSLVQSKKTKTQAFQFVDNRPQSAAQRRIVQMAESHQAVDKTIQSKTNGTGLPGNLKSGVENLSGYTMDDVKVHYNSAKPAQLNAHAYAQGTDIHIAPGQEKHLPHEAWHVVQQKQGRVKPTMQMKGGVAVNDEASLEREADVMGQKAVQRKTASAATPGSETKTDLKASESVSGSAIVQRELKVKGEKINLNNWLETYVGKNSPEVAEVIRKWDSDDSHTEDYDSDIILLQSAQQEAKSTYTSQNEDVAKSIGKNSPPLKVGFGSVSIWAQWYFSGLEYQNNSTNGWHANRAGLLPGKATQDGEPTVYVEFRRPGAIGKKDVSKMERCVFNMITGQCYPNAHYDGGYVEISGVPQSIIGNMRKEATQMTGLSEEYKEMSVTDKQKFPPGPELVLELLRRMKSKPKETDEKKEE